MANGTPNQQLQGLLTNLQTALNNLATQTGGNSAYYQTYYQDVYNAITGSPQLLAQFNSAASSPTTPLAGFTLGASGGTIQFNPSTNTVQLPATYLTSWMKNSQGLPPVDGHAGISRTRSRHLVFLSLEVTSAPTLPHVACYVRQCSAIYVRR